MKTVFKGAFVDGLLDQGRAEMLLKLLERRFGVPASIIRRVEACNDTVQINTRFERTISASSLDEVFAELRVHVWIPAIMQTGATNHIGPSKFHKCARISRM